MRFYDFDVPGNSQVHTAIYYTTDANYNVTALVDTAGAVVERYYYDPYGKATICDANWQPLHYTGFTPLGIRYNDGGWSAYGNEILCCGYFYDDETSQDASVTVGASGNYCCRHRYLSTAFGTFINRDPIQADMNLYRYCGDNPVLLVDSSGLCSCSSDPKVMADQVKSGEAVEVPDRDGDGKPDYKFPNELAGTGYTVYCYTNNGGMFYVQAPDGSFVHRCPFPDGVSGAGYGIIKWRVTNKGGIFNGCVDDPGTGRKITYNYYSSGPLNGRLTIKVYNKYGICYREQIKKGPKEPSDLPFPEDVPPTPLPRTR